MAGILDNPVGATPVLQVDPNAQGFKATGPGGILGQPQMTPAQMSDSVIGRGIQSVAQKQGSGAMVFIGDLAKEIGVPAGALTEVLPSLAQQGLVNLHKSFLAESRLSPERAAGVINWPNGMRFHAVSLPKTE